MIRLHETTLGEEEIQAVVDVMRSGQVTQGKKVLEFEAAFSDDHAVMCNSGSSANLLAVAALCDPDDTYRLNPGDEVIVSALSWSTTIWPLVQYGLVPVIVDIDPATLNIDPTEVTRAITSKTRAIMPVHVYGNPCDMRALWEIRERHDLAIIEDCCEALGAEFDGKPVGSFSDLATFSFYYSHHITTVEGGICTTPYENLGERLRILRAHGWVREAGDDWAVEYPDIDPRFLFVGAGYNLRSTEMAAAMGLVQLPKLAGFVEKRRAAAWRLLQAFGRYKEYLTCQRDAGRSSWFGFPITISEDAPFTAKDMRAAFHDIETRPIICGNIALQPGLQHYPHRTVGDLPNATHVMKNGFAIGCHQDMDGAACDYVRDVLDIFMAAYV